MEPFSGWSLVIAFDLGTRGFNEFAVIDPGRAGGHASDATEAGIEVPDPFFRHLRLAFEGHFHEIDAAAGGIHLFPPENVGGTGGKAEAAVDAFFDEFLCRRLVGVEGAGENRIFIFGGHAIRFPQRSGRD
jgi:hypothetical protein